MAKVENLGNLVSVITKNSKFMIFDNNNVLTNAGLNNPNKINITENGTYYLVNNLDSNYSNSDIDIELVINEGVNASIVELIKTEKDITLSRGVNLKENSELNIITIYESSTNKTVIKAKTVLEKGAYLNSKSLSLFMGEVESLYDENLTGEKAKIEGYYILKCISTLDRAQTDANKLVIVEQRKKAAFNQEYDAFVNTLARKLNEKLWQKVELIHAKDVDTSNFFAIYNKYFQ